MKTQIKKDLEAAAAMGLSYGHYKAYQKSLAEKRKKRRNEKKSWTKDRKDIYVR